MNDISLCEVTDGAKKMLLDGLGLKTALSVATTIAFYLTGRPDDAAIALGAVMLLDLCTGIWANYRKRNLSSTIGFRKTLTKFVGYFIAVSVGNLIGVMAPFLGFTRTFVIVYLGVTEGISIVENLSIAGVKSLDPLAGKLRMAREKLTDIQTEVSDG
ncbi:MAG: phage holin family protein [Lawsonella sp.]